VTSEVQSDDMKPVGEPLLGKLSKAPAVPRDAVQADDRWGRGVAPL